MVGIRDGVGLGLASDRIAGGFARVPVGALARAWRACKAEPLGIADFRAWLALREMAARRCTIGRGRDPEFGPDELAALLGVSARRAAASASRLVTAGLLAWSPGALAFPGDDGPGDDALADSIGGGRGHVDVPRRILRHLARQGRASLIAAAIGVLLRCLSHRKGGFDGRGRVKASWIARAFAVDLRAVKAARRDLIALGWIAPEPSDQIAENRWGRAYRIDLAWAPPADPAGPARDVADRHPPRAPGCRVSPPPLLHQDPLQEQERNQEPAPGGPAGVETGGRERRGETAPASEDTPKPTRGAAEPGPGALPPPRLADVRPEDLVDVGRVLELHREAAGRGLVGSSEADRLKFAAAAEHARCVGRRNPCGLFARIVAKGWWDYATLAEEERGSRRLREHLSGRRPPPGEGPLAVAGGPVSGPGPARTGPGRRAPMGPVSLFGPAGATIRGGPSADALLVREVRAATIRAGIFRDPFPEFARLTPGWDRGRWDAALAEWDRPMARP